MAGFRILYVPPRRVGAIADWSGLKKADGTSWLIKRAQDLGFNALWFSPMHETAQVKKLFHGKVIGNSLYAIRNHFALDAEFSSGKPAEDIRHYRHFVTTAKKNGLTVFADLVFNHVAADHPLVKQEEELLEKIQAKSKWTAIPATQGKDTIGIHYEENGASKTYYFLFKYDVHHFPQADLLKRRICGPADDPWADVAQINYDSPAAQDFFLTGKSAYWKKQIDWYMDKIGISAFRCDAAYMIAPEAWEGLINYARGKNPEAFFLAETLGAPDHMAAGLGQARSKDKKGQEHPAFDLGMSANHWWDFVGRWLPDHETPRLNKMAKYGATGSPDNHDTSNTLAGYLTEAFNTHAQRDQIVADVSVRNYAISAFIGNSVYMQMGYELCNQVQNGVFKDIVTPQAWQKLVGERGEGHALNISKRIRQINDIKAALGVENCQADFRSVRELEDGKIILMHVAYRDVDRPETPLKEAVLLINRRSENGPVEISEKILQDFADKGFVTETSGNSIKDVVILHTPFAPQPKPGITPSKNKHQKPAAP